MTALLALGALLWGALSGALLPRAAHRLAVPDGEPRRVRCEGGHVVRGWVGRTPCGQCAATTGPGLPLVTALVCAALAAATGPRPELAVWSLLAPAGVLLGVIDLRVRRLPDVLTLPLAAATLALLGIAALLPGHAGHWPTALYGALVLGAAYTVLHLVNPAGMGFGDAKLALSAGAALGWYGWPAVLLGTFTAVLSGALYGGALVAVRKAARKTGVAFGPFLLAGTLAGVLIGAYTALS
ncbi:prepilin peptidase [Streptomyces sp. AM6-12]|uniref:prepilin peptidase n=1 Tax=Streptomyces sp. AM6-12 TaxID=3345149 RepID=UPI0037A13A89